MYSEDTESQGKAGQAMQSGNTLGNQAARTPRFGANTRDKLMESS